MFKINVLEVLGLYEVLKYSKHRILKYYEIITDLDLGIIFVGWVLLVIKDTQREHWHKNIGLLCSAVGEVRLQMIMTNKKQD